MNKTYAEHTARLNEFVAQLSEYPETRFSGRGIVICAGGSRYFTNAWVCANILRMHGCNLPIQFWHLGPDEMSDEMRELVRPLGVICVDAYELRKKYPARILNGWELKPYAIINSPFEEVLFLDADNVAVKNPEYLFSTEQYKETGVIFWPDFDFQRLKQQNNVWSIMQIPYVDEPAFESGQIVIDKRRSWKALQITMHLNEWSDFYYQHIHGDKDTFHLAWRKLNQSYAMPSRTVHGLPGTMCQHDFLGVRIFQHRNLRKWSVTEPNSTIPEFWFEAECLQFLAELRDKWSATPKAKLSKSAQLLHDQVVQQRHYMYIRNGYDARAVALLPAGQIAAGCKNAAEHTWAITGTAETPRVGIFSGDSLLVDLSLGGQGMLYGNWVKYERMPCVLLPITASKYDKLSPIFWTAQYGEDVWLANNADLPTRGTFIEVGLGTGLQDSNTYWLEQLGWRGLLVEADARNLSQIHRLRTTPVEHVAAASFDGEITFTPHADSTLSGVLRHGSKSTAADVIVETRRLDTLIRQHDLATPDVLSIDTEGTELDVLDGLGAVRPRYLIVEYGTIDESSAIERHDGAAALERTSAKLADMGYTVMHQTRSNLIAQYTSAQNG